MTALSRVTAHHCFALADASKGDETAQFAVGDLDATIEQFDWAGLTFATCYPSTQAEMPVRHIFKAGLSMAHGTDEVCDRWVRHGNADSLQGALIESLTLDTIYTEHDERGTRPALAVDTDRRGAVLKLDAYGNEGESLCGFRRSRRAVAEGSDPHTVAAHACCPGS